jgi:hypothetical protein
VRQQSGFPGERAPAGRAGQVHDDQEGEGLYQAARTTTIRAPDAVSAVTFSPDSARLAIGCNSRLALVTDLTGRRLSSLRHGFLALGISSVAFNPASGQLATATSSGNAWIWPMGGSRARKVTHAAGLEGGVREFRDDPSPEDPASQARSSNRAPQGSPRPRVVKFVALLIFSYLQSLYWSPGCVDGGGISARTAFNSSRTSLRWFSSRA